MCTKAPATLRKPALPKPGVARGRELRNREEDRDGDDHRVGRREAREAELDPEELAAALRAVDALVRQGAEHDGAEEPAPSTPFSIRG